LSKDERRRSRFDKLSANGFYKGYSKFAKVQLRIRPPLRNALNRLNQSPGRIQHHPFEVQPREAAYRGAETPAPFAYGYLIVECGCPKNSLFKKAVIPNPVFQTG
jgi:hypothetical protein